MLPVLLATCAAFPDGDQDEAQLCDALAAEGVDARYAVWTDEAVDWSGALTVLRSTWDYTLRRAQFLSWLPTVPVLHNPVDVVRWNSDKVYLHDLEADGVPITPTAVVPPGTAAEFPDEAEFVVKPSVGAGSRGAGRFAPGADESARVHAAALHEAGRTVLVQPYLDAVDDAGETALIYLDGTFSHAIRKGAMLSRDTAHDVAETSGLFLEENISPRTPSPAELAVGERTLAALADRFGATLLYARIDLLPGPDGPVVVEVELTEPSLFLGTADDAVRRFAAAVARYARYAR
jgi:glutathione synthase/RimK-type ligase-like ATP-grasp enzyme